MLGDTAIALMKKTRIQTSSWKESPAAVMNREIPIIPTLAQPEFGTGAAKVTPGARSQ